MNAGLALDGEYAERNLPLLIQRRGMAEWDGDRVRILDRRRLPHELVFIECAGVDDVARAIEEMAIQGAFTLALAAGYGVALALPARGASSDTRAALDRAVARLERTRRTGSALQRMLARTRDAALAAVDAGANPRTAVVATVDGAASALARQALSAARRALPLIGDGHTILTHCFADRTLLYLLVEAKRNGMTVPVVCTETRPYLQGARLTAFSVQQVGHPVTLITDGMAGLLLRQGIARAFLTGADRVCLDGTICNKIGTYPIALAARANGVPYYVLRQSGPDPESRSEADVVLEYRDEESVLAFAGARLAPWGVRGLYPAFDVTPASLVTAVVTDRGVFPASEILRYTRATPAVTDALL